MWGDDVQPQSCVNTDYHSDNIKTSPSDIPCIILWLIYK